MEKLGRYDVPDNYVEIAIAVLETLVASIDEDNEQGLYEGDQVEASQSIKASTEKVIAFLSVAYQLYKENKLEKE